MPITRNSLTDEQLAQLCADRAIEASEYTTSTKAFDGKISFRSQWSRNKLRFVGVQHDSEPLGGHVQFTNNRIQPQIISQVAAQLMQPWREVMSADQGEDEPTYGLTAAAVRRIRRLLQQGKLIATQIDGEDGEPGQTFLPLQMIDPATGQPATDAEGRPAMIRLDEGKYLGREPLAIEERDALIELTGVFEEDDFQDATNADAVDRAHAIIARQHQGLDDIVGENELWTGINGHGVLMTEFDSKLPNRWKTCNPEVINVLFDPNATRIEDMDYAMVYLVMDQDAAINRWPDKKKLIEAAASAGQVSDTLQSITGWYSDMYGGATEGGNPDFYHDTSMRLSGKYDVIQFRRDMVVVRASWLRNYEVPVSIGEALDTLAVAPLPDAPIDESGKPVLYLTDDDGEPDVTRPVVHGKDGWPAKNGVLQVFQLVSTNEILEKGPCPYYDIPLCLNRNVPYPGSPYGIGEPYIAEDPQKMLNHCATIVANHLLAYQFPTEYWPKSLLETLEEDGIETHYYAGRQIGIEDHTWEEYFASGKFKGFAVEPAQLNGDVLNVLQTWFGEIDRVQSYAQVMQGNTPSAGMSGEALKTLTDQAMGPVGYKAKFTEMALERLLRLHIDGNFTKGWLKLRDWRAHFPDEPIWMVRDWRERCKRIRVNANVEVAAGSGQVKQVKYNKADSLFDKGLLSPEAYLERLDEPDPKATVAERVEWEQEQAERQMEAQAAMQPAGPVA